jgi:hypothetical protein
VTLRACWVTLRARWVTFTVPGLDVDSEELMQMRRAAARFRLARKWLRAAAVYTASHIVALYFWQVGQG